MWQDPKGVYFYPVNWLLSGPERLLSGGQHALDYRYYYVVDLNLNDPNGVNLGTITWPEIEAIAKRNGWFESMEEFRKQPIDVQKKQLFHYSRPELPGSFFWHFVDRMVKDGKITWAKAYRGVSFVRDPNLSIIHSNEPDQVLVLDPRIIKIIDFGENKNPIKWGEDSDKLKTWLHGLMAIIKQVRGEYGGELTWKNKLPTLTFGKGWGKFILTIPERSSALGDVGLSLSYTYGRAYDSMYVGYKDLSNQSVDQIVQTIRNRVDQTAKLKSDLLFKPVITIEEGKKIMVEQVMDNHDVSINVRISNSSNPHYNDVTLHSKFRA